MSELIDYSGKFDPEFSHDRFSKETLLNLLKAYSEYMRHIDAFWYLIVKDKWGNDKAIDCDLRVWEKIDAYQIRTLSNLLNIHGDDVVTVMKYLQVNPWNWLHDCVIDTKNNNHAIFTYRTCPTLVSLEKEGKGRERQQCHVVCSRAISFIASYFNPNIKVTPLKLPPRESNNEICCQWEFKLDREYTPMPIADETAKGKQGGNVSELIDYSGKFDPKFSHDKFTKETLINLLKAYSEYMHRIDGFWYLIVKDKWGNDEAMDCDLRVWKRAKRYEIRTISNLLNIHGDDVVTVMKYLQVYPWVWIRDSVIDIKNNNHAIFTYRTCPTLVSLEKEGKGRERQQCHVVCSKGFGLNASYFNPNIKVTPLKLPPRESNNDICCQWEFNLER